MKLLSPLGPLLLLLGASAFCPPASLAEPSFALTFFDVGEGDATLIENFADSCEERILIDAGNFMSGAQLSQKLLQDPKKKLHALILTHPHPDHIGGVFALLSQHSISSLFDNGQPFTDKELLEGTNRWYLKAVRKDSHYQELRSPKRLPLTCGGSLEVLWPPEGALSGDWNNNSIIMLFTRGSFRALFMGDALRETEQALVAQKILLEPVTVLKAGHHASEHTADEMFIKKAHPKLTIVSAGIPNPYGYPSKRSLAAYSSLSRVLRTDVAGTIVVHGYEKGAFTVTSEK